MALKFSGQKLIGCWGYMSKLIVVSLLSLHPLLIVIIAVPASYRYYHFASPLLLYWPVIASLACCYHTVSWLQKGVKKQLYTS